MSRLVSILRRFARTYLAAMGGGVALVTLIGLAENAKEMLHRDGEMEYFRGAGFVLLVSVLAVVAGFAIHRFCRWSLVLAGGMGALVVVIASQSLASDPLRPETFTIVLPMTLTLVCACLPATWLEFRKKGAKAN